MSDHQRRLLERIKHVGMLSSIQSLLDWDQEVLMPEKGLLARAEQMSLLAGLEHQLLTADETRRLLDEAREEAHEDDVVLMTNLRETRRLHERASRIPQALVEAFAKQTIIAKGAWVQARKANDFAGFAPKLAPLVDLKKQMAEHIGYRESPYEALIDEYEPGAKVTELAAVFADLRQATIGLLDKIRASSVQPDDAILTRPYPRERQEKLVKIMAERLGFSFRAGRIDVSAHPFCTSIGGAADVRVTTRYLESFLPSGLFGILHEVGHALYEQGLPFEHVFTPMAHYISLGIHESQSRLWENMIGRSRPFWEGHYADLQALFPEALGDVDLDAFHAAINAVKPSLIRVEADELTYNLHIILRFELERELFEGALDVADLPEAWNAKTRDYLGITPPGDRDGCLQDIHWSMGAFGYFPTYTLGNLYAAQIFEQARNDIPDLFDRVARGDHATLLAWLREHVHRHGQRYRAGELIERLTGRPLSIEAFMNYVTGKFNRIYHLE